MSWTATPAEIALLDRTIERLAPYFEKPDIGQDNVARVRDVIRSISSGGVAATMESTDLQRTLMFCKLLRYLCAQPPPVPVPCPDPYYFFKGSISEIVMAVAEIRFYYDAPLVYPAGETPSFRLDLLPSGSAIWQNGAHSWALDEHGPNGPDATGLPFYLVQPQIDIPEAMHPGDRYRVSAWSNGIQLTAFHYVVSDLDDS